MQFISKLYSSGTNRILFVLILFISIFIYIQYDNTFNKFYFVFNHEYYIQKGIISNIRSSNDIGNNTYHYDVIYEKNEKVELIGNYIYKVNDSIPLKISKDNKRIVVYNGDQWSIFDSIYYDILMICICLYFFTCLILNLLDSKLLINCRVKFGDD